MNILLFNFCRCKRLHPLLATAFIYILGEMRYLFFPCNRPNYARWMVRYQLNLANISIRRTNKAFSRTTVNLTLEQTVNADAASKSTGISAFTTSDNARTRWMLTKSARSSIIGILMKHAGLSNTDDAHKELKSYRIWKDNEDFHRIEDGIQNRMNPFELEPDENLYCLTSGRSVS